MKLLTKIIGTTVIALSVSAAYASPKFLITHNKTSVESNAFIAGVVPSVHPTKANSDGKVTWSEVRIACLGHIVNGKCSALIKMETNTSHPVDIGTATMDLESGLITFAPINEKLGYVFTINGPGETTISKK